MYEHSTFEHSIILCIYTVWPFLYFERNVYIFRMTFWHSLYMSFLYSYIFSSQYTNFPGENMLPSILCPIQAVFQEKAQVTMLTFLERTYAPSHNTYCRSCLSSCSINIIYTDCPRVYTSRDSCYSSHRSAWTFSILCVMTCPPILLCWLCSSNRQWICPVIGQCQMENQQFGDGCD